MGGDEVVVRTDLYRGTAAAYDHFRVGYPPALLDDLLTRTRPSGRGWLIDLGCGTGQIAFALRDRFAAVWAVDQEPQRHGNAESSSRRRSESDGELPAGRVLGST